MHSLGKQTGILNPAVVELSDCKASEYHRAVSCSAHQAVVNPRLVRYAGPCSVSGNAAIQNVAEDLTHSCTEFEALLYCRGPPKGVQQADACSRQGQNRPNCEDRQMVVWVFVLTAGTQPMMSCRSYISARPVNLHPSLARSIEAPARRARKTVRATRSPIALMLANRVAQETNTKVSNRPWFVRLDTCEQLLEVPSMQYKKPLR